MKTNGLKTALVLIITLFLFASCDAVLSGIQDRLVEKELVSFLIPAEGNTGIETDIAGTINQAAGIVDLVLPWDWTVDVTSLAADFTYKGFSIAVDGTEQIPGETVNNFSSSLQYRITDGQGNIVYYRVDVEQEEVPAPWLSSFEVSPDGGTTWYAGSIDQSAFEIDVEIPEGEALTSLVIQFVVESGDRLYEGTTEQTSGTSSHDFTSPITFTTFDSTGVLNASDSQNYEVTVVNAVLAPSMTAFGFTTADNFSEGLLIDVAGTIDQTAGTIAVSLISTVTLTSLIADFTVNSGNTVNISGTDQTSGSTAHDFSSPVLYTVETSHGLETKEYTVTVTQEAGWQPVVARKLDGVSSDGVEQVDMVIDPDTGDIYVACIVSSGQALEVFMYDASGDNWTQFLDSFPTTAASPRLSMKNGTAYLGFAADTGGGNWDISIMNCIDGLSWNYFGDSGTLGDEFFFNNTGADYDFDVDVNSTGTVYVAVQDVSLDSANPPLTVIYADPADLVWSTLFSDIGGTIYHPEIKINSQDDVYVGYVDDVSSDGTSIVPVMTVWDVSASGFLTVPATGGTTTVNDPVHINTAGSTDAYLACTDSLDTLTILAFDGASWSDYDSTGLGVTTAVNEVDIVWNGSTLYAAFEGDAGGSYTVSENSGTGWSVVGDSLFTPDGSQFASVGYYLTEPYLAFIDTDFTSGVSVYVYK